MIFDFFRVLRKTFKTRDLLTYFQDILFWIFTGISILYNMYKFNSGEIRVYVFAGIILGTIIYMLAISKYVIKINVFILKILILLISTLIIKPFKVIKKYILLPFKTVIDILKQKNMVKNNFLVKIFNKNVAIKKDFKI